MRGKSTCVDISAHWCVCEGQRTPTHLLHTEVLLDPKRVDKHDRLLQMPHLQHPPDQFHQLPRGNSAELEDGAEGIKVSGMPSTQHREDPLLVSSSQYRIPEKKKKKKKKKDTCLTTTKMLLIYNTISLACSTGLCVDTPHPNSIATHNTWTCK